MAKSLFMGWMLLSSLSLAWVGFSDDTEVVQTAIYSEKPEKQASHKATTTGKKVKHTLSSESKSGTHDTEAAEVKLLKHEVDKLSSEKKTLEAQLASKEKSKKSTMSKTEAVQGADCTDLFTNDKCSENNGGMTVVAGATCADDTCTKARDAAACCEATDCVADPDNAITSDCKCTAGAVSNSCKVGKFCYDADGDGANDCVDEEAPKALCTTAFANDAACATATGDANSRLIPAKTCASSTCTDASTLSAGDVDPELLRCCQVPACTTDTPAIGILALDGYSYPTQPGDIDDKRSYCEVTGTDGSDYACKSYAWQDGVPHFSVVKSNVATGTWPRIQDGVWDADMQAGFKAALKRLMENPDVCGIVGHAGFFSFYQFKMQDIASELMAEAAVDAVISRKPMLLGSLAMTFAFGHSVNGNALPKWGLLDDTENKKVAIIASNFPKVTPDFLDKVLANASVLDDTDGGGNLLRKIRAETIPGQPADLGPCGGTVNASLVNGTREQVHTALRDHYGISVMNCGEEDSIKMLNEMIAEYGENWTETNAKHFLAVGWNNAPGYGIPVVYAAAFHNNLWTVKGGERGKSSFMVHLQEVFQNATALDYEIIAILMESTEMPALSNSVRALKGLPVWDASTFTKCVMTAALRNDYDTLNEEMTTTLYRSTTFRECMMEWYDNPTKHETMFGLQKSTGKYKFYEDQNFTQDQLDNLMCTGGRPENLQPGQQPIGRLMSEFDRGDPDDASGPPVLCQTTGLYCYCAGCTAPCPGSGDCGGDSACGVRGEDADSAACKAVKAQTVENYHDADCPGPGAASSVIVAATNW